MQLIALALSLLVFSVRAGECDKDAEKYCSGITPGRGQLSRCLNDYKQGLSQECSNALKLFTNKSVKNNPCFEELTEFCSDLPSDPHSAELCLLKHESRLGKTCLADFQKKRSKILLRDICAQDIVTNCYGEISGQEGAMNRCVIRNKSKLSLSCQRRVEQKIAELKKKNLCFDDTEKFCPTQTRFVDIQDCLSKKMPSLSLNCKKLVQIELDKMKANPCYRDLITHCRMGLAPSDQHRCLTLNEEHLTHVCKQFRAAEKDKVKKMIDLCEKDRIKHCEDVPQKDGQVLKCLKRNKEKLSLPCKQLLK